MRVLLIKLKHIGDALLLTPTIDALRANHPRAEIWVLVRDGCQGILAGCPSIDRVLTAPSPARHERNWAQRLDSLKLVGTLLTRRFDHVFELSDGDRGRWLATFAQTSHRCANGGVRPMGWGWRRVFHDVSDFDWLGMHSVEKDFRTVAAGLPIGDEPPGLTFCSERTEPWPVAAGFTDFAFLHPATRWERKEWPTEHWLELGERLLTRVSRIVLSCGPDSREIAATRDLATRLGERASFTEGALSWRQMAWMLHRARLFVGVDTAAMHLAAGCDCPTVAVFGPSVPWVWHPWKVRNEIVAPVAHPTYSGVYEQFNEVARLKTADVSVEAVWSACERLMRPAAVACGDVDEAESRMADDEGDRVDIRA